MPTIAVIHSLVKTISSLSFNLPPSIKQGSKTNKIWAVMNMEEGKTPHETLNWHFNAMGKLGLGFVCTYLSKIDWAADFFLNLVETKLQRLVSELEYLKKSDVSSITQAQPAHCTVPTAKLTDENNLEQPKLPFQCKAVDAYHEKQPQDVALQIHKEHGVSDQTESRTIDENNSWKVKKPHISSGNPTAVDNDGFLANLNVQEIDDETVETCEDKQCDVDQFFHLPVTKKVKQKEKKYRTCKICP
ncbi:hypothetical protein C0993_000858 [Termitomyces sp. T159_Od127]|nr:hypothetical protein C0993_000858 [Termitomyces sp. T159_Od127]